MTNNPKILQRRIQTRMKGNANQLKAVNYHDTESNNLKVESSTQLIKISNSLRNISLVYWSIWLVYPDLGWRQLFLLPVCTQRAFNNGFLFLGFTKKMVGSDLNFEAAILSMRWVEISSGGFSVQTGQRRRPRRPRCSRYARVAYTRARHNPVVRVVGQPMSSARVT